MADRDLFLVFSNATAGQDAEFNQWYDSVHVPDVLDVPGVESAQRYDLAPMEVPEYAVSYTHLTLPTNREV